MADENKTQYLVTDDRDMIYGYFQTEVGARKYIQKFMANSHSYDIPHNYFIIEINKIILVNTDGEENA